MELAGTVAVVIGASRGIGKYFALSLAGAGAKVVVAARSQQSGRLAGTIGEVVEEICASGGEAIGARVDATQPDDLHYAIGQAIYHYGRVDTLVYNAATYERRPFLNITPDYFDNYMALNLKGAVIAAQAVIPYMIDQGGGSIINVSSSTATQVSSNSEHLCLYGVSKAGLNRLSTWLAGEYGCNNVAVNALSPGGVYTENLEVEMPIQDLTRFKRPSVEYLGPPIVYLAKQRAAGVTGQTLLVPEFGTTWPTER